MKLLVILVAGLCIVMQALAADAGLPDRVPKGHQTQWLVDDERRLNTLEQLQAAEGRLDWTQSDTDNLSFGFTDAPYWFRFSIEAVASADQAARYLQIPESLLNHIDIYLLRGGEVVDHIQMGADYPFAKRPVQDRQFVAPVRLSTSETTEFFIRVQTSGSMQFAPVHWNPQAFTEHTRLESLASGLYYGSMLVMFFYNLFLFFVVRDRSYLYYISFVGVFTLFMASLHGDTYQFLWPRAVAWNETSVAFFIAATGLTTILFTTSFLKLKHNARRSYLLLRAMLAISCLLLVLTLVLPYEQIIRPTTLHGILIMAVVLFISSRMWIKGFHHARYFVMAWVALLLGTLALALSKFGVLPWNAFTANGAQIGAVIEVLLLSFALGDRIARERAARFKAQNDALESSRMAQDAQKELLETQKSLNEELEIRVGERTRELEATLNELETVNRFLEDVSNSDQLTRLYNRHYFVNRYHEEYRRAQRQQIPLSVIMLDIDHFKDFNDTYVHIAGDECLKLVADALNACISRAGDTLARYGGEEFIVLLSHTDLEGARTVGERLRTAVEKVRFRVEGEVVPVTVSVGVAAVIPEDFRNAERVIQLADEALYVAKEQGRNRVR
jgi:diguanylate cyclase